MRVNTPVPFESGHSYTSPASLACPLCSCVVTIDDFCDPTSEMNHTRPARFLSSVFHLPFLSFVIRTVCFLVGRGQRGLNLIRLEKLYVYRSTRPRRLIASRAEFRGRFGRDAYSGSSSSNRSNVDIQRIGLAIDIREISQLRFKFQRRNLETRTSCSL